MPRIRLKRLEKKNLDPAVPDKLRCFSAIRRVWNRRGDNRPPSRVVEAFAVFMSKSCSAARASDEDSRAGMRCAVGGYAVPADGSERVLYFLSNQSKVEVGCGEDAGTHPAVAGV